MNLLAIVSRDTIIFSFDSSSNLFFLWRQVITFIYNNVVNCCLNFGNNCINATLALRALANFDNLLSDIYFPKK
jgi:hypothetical protein